MYAKSPTLTTLSHIALIRFTDKTVQKVDNVLSFCRYSPILDLHLFINFANGIPPIQKHNHD